jgi:hypothetical protein
MTYEQLAMIAENEDIEVIEINFRGHTKGLYSDNVISINSSIETTIEKKCILAEEMGHHYTTSGNILDLKAVSNRKQECLARNWSFEKLVPLKELINASFNCCTNIFELAEYFDITEQFLSDVLKYYESKYGLFIEIDDYCIYFNPLTVCKYNYDK